MDPSAPVEGWVAGVNDAGWGFHRTLDLSDNAVSSPASIGMAFSLVRAGASDEAGAALDEVFAFPADTAVHEAANAVDAALAASSTGTTILEVANRLFPDDDFEPSSDFVDVAARFYGATADPVDTSDGAAAAEEINGWVSDRTRELIPQIVDAGTVQDAELISVNTVYLFAEWADPFLAELTTDDEFTTPDGGTVTAPFMQFHAPREMRYATLDGADADAVKLPYAEGDLAMWVVVPRDDTGLAAVEETVTAAELAALDDIANDGRVDLSMPKWEAELPPEDLFAWLCPLGFCAGAAFDGIAPGLFITDALHGAKVIVDEKGTEAAAATTTGFATSEPPPPDLDVDADHPFLWTIVHEPTGTLLFVGRVTDPTAG